MKKKRNNGLTVIAHLPKGLEKQFLLYEERQEQQLKQWKDFLKKKRNEDKHTYQA